MKKYIYIVFLLSLFSCSPDIFEKEDTGQGNMYLTIYNTASTKAADEPSYPEAPDPGTDIERLINKLDIFFYVHGRGEDEGAYMHVQKRDLHEDSGMLKVPIYISSDQETALFGNGNGQNSSIKVFVIANLRDDITLPATTSRNNLRNLVVKSDEFASVVGADGSFVAPETFVMAGEADVTRVHVTGNNHTITGTVSLVRAASKVTMSFWIPESLSVQVLQDKDGDFVKDPDEEYISETWHPYFKDNDPTKGVEEMHIGFHKGLAKTYIGNQEYIDNEVFETAYSRSFTYKGQTTKDSKTYYLYSCDVSFYSYSKDWSTDSDDLRAPYFTFMIPWVREGDYTRYQTYYYQVVVNGKTKKMVRNKWYDITLTINKLGSRVQNQAYVIEDPDQSYQVLDWATAHAGVSGPATSENVVLNEWRYLVVPETTIEINNKDEGYISFDASHSVALQFQSATYIDCSGNTPDENAEVSTVNAGCFSLDKENDRIIFTHPIDDARNSDGNKIFSPMTVKFRMWLDLGNYGQLDKNEEEFVENITIVQYPPIYIIPDKSTQRSVYVNGKQTHVANTDDLNSDNSGNNRHDIIINNTYNLGVSHGTSSSNYMYVINVSSFNETDTFPYKENPSAADYTSLNYLIGDPRTLTPNNNLNNDRFDMSMDKNNTDPSKGWVKDGKGEILTNYYPTSSEDQTYQLIAPKFRVVSMLSSGYSRINKEGAAMRCASYQEDGFPAGRWRLPTAAEIMYIINLQGEGAIKELFYGGNAYFSSTHIVRTKNDSEGRGFKQYEVANENTKASVRCVYDEWYWGSEREATLNPNPGNDQQYPDFDKYLFTWGDEPR